MCDENQETPRSNLAFEEFRGRPGVLFRVVSDQTDPPMVNYYDSVEGAKAKIEWLEQYGYTVVSVDKYKWKAGG